MLSALIWVPILSAALVGFWPGTITPKAARQLSLIVAIVMFVWSLVLASQFNPENASQQFSEYIPWIDSLGLTYYLGVDGLSLPLMDERGNDGA